MPDLTVNLGKLQLKNPVMTASGTFGYGVEYADFFPLDRLGAVVVKGIRMEPSHGNPTPRVAEVTGGMLNAIGLQGPGVEKFLHGEEYLPFLRQTGATVIVNIWGKTIEEYRDVAAAVGIGGFEGGEGDGELMAEGLRGLVRRLSSGGKLSDLGVSREDLVPLAELALSDPCMLTNPRRFAREEVASIYGRCL